MRIVLAASFAVAVASCGGSTKPAEPPKPEGQEAKGDAAHVAKGDEPKKTAKPTKYPDPWLEPDCTSVPADGYLQNGKQVVADVRRKHWKELVACADEAPAGENVSGEIVTSFRLDPDGVPRCVEAPGAPDSLRPVVNCVVYVYRSFRFPPPKNGSIRISDGIRLDVSHTDEAE
jgi:hypothetical protein